MKCPKCGYLSLDPVERCRHCGYRFSLNTPAPIRTPELPLRQDASAVAPLDDLALVDRATSPLPPSPHDLLGDGIERGNGQASHETESADVPDLPLFARPMADDEPLITRASAPRAPLAVRRSTPEVPRLRTERMPLADVPLPGLEAPERAPRFGGDRRAMPRQTPSAPPVAAASGDNAGILPRTIGAVIDLLVLFGVDLLVVYFTLQIGGIAWADRAIVPKAPLIVFLVLQNLGYLIAFTTGGQTLGQMAMGIRVVAADGHRPPPPAQAVVRTLVWVVLTLPAGVGLLTTVFDKERRGLHDRAAGTRVIRL